MNSLYGLLLFMLSSGICLSQTIERITSDEAVNVLKNLEKKSSVIIDGRDSARYHTGYIKGAFYLDAYHANALTELKKYLGKETIFVYCTTNNRTAIITGMLEQLKYTGKIIEMTDGITGWKEKGYNVEIAHENIPIEKAKKP